MKHVRLGLIVLLFGAMAATSFASELVKVFETEGGRTVTHVEMDSVRRAGVHQYTVWTLDDYKVPVPSSLFAFRSMRKQHLIDCASGTDTRLQATFYESNMGAGIFVHRGKLNNQPQAFRGPMTTVANMLCGRRESPGTREPLTAQHQRPASVATARLGTLSR